jgi:hypothetical protein
LATEYASFGEPERLPEPPVQKMEKSVWNPASPKMEVIPESELKPIAPELDASVMKQVKKEGGWYRQGVTIPVCSIGETFIRKIYEVARIIDNYNY